MYNYDRHSKEGFYAFVLFLIWPFLAAIVSLFKYERKWAKNIFWLFIVFYGFTFAIGTDNRTADIVRYIAHFQDMHHQEMTLSTSVDYYQQSGEIDVLKTLISITLSRFTDNSAMLTMTYAVIFGFFFTRNMWYVLERLERKLKPITILLVICFFMIIPIWDFNGFRMWTATHIFFYGLLPFLYEGKKHGIVISCSSIFVHFSFIVPVLILGVYMVLGNRLVVYFAAFVLTFFISEINLDSFNQLVESYAPEIFQERTAAYRGEAYVEGFREGVDAGSSNNWYAEWYEPALKWSVMGFLCILFVTGREFFKNNRGWLNLFSFTLIFYSAANLLSSLPSGGRFIAVANLCALALIILYQQNQEQEAIMKRFVFLASPALLLFIIVSLRVGLSSISTTTVLGNPIVAFFTMEENLSINDLLRLIM